MPCLPTLHVVYHASPRARLPLTSRLLCHRPPQPRGAQELEVVTSRCIRAGGFVVELRAMMRKIGYLLQSEFEGLEFAVGAYRRWRVTVLIPGGRTDLPILEYGGEGADFRVAVQVASFWALLDLRHAHDEKLRTIAFRSHPARQEGEFFSLFYNT
ncbi:hypothetical protein GUJ93_ZPchr0016g2622 [Zizania palustris]|uniref:Uncharacterized protein n=1 Tax=Zizania palustris TaxID=103762 RepID=A0A8J5TDH8_ZIZPA|nr:hypothetical protein GUJ93_ZPchr0016g2622 [Zizania palustris]